MQTSRIFKRGETFYYRRRIPPALRKSKSHSFIISLKTSDANQAERLAFWYDQHFNNLITRESMYGLKIDPRNIRKLTYKINSDGSRELSMSEEEWKAATPEKIAALHGTIVSTEQNETIKPTETRHYPKISEAVELYYEFKKRYNKGYKLDSKIPGKYRRLSEILDDRPVNKITVPDADRVVDVITALPENAAAYRGMHVNQILKEDYDETLTVKSINDHLGEYRSFFNFLNRDYDIKNVFNGLVLKETDVARLITNELRGNFKREDLISVFKNTRFSGQQYEKEFEFWTPLIALYTGARRNEIAQLRTYDIVKEYDIWYIDFTTEKKKDDKGHKKLKNVGSARKTPIHPQLIELGFIDYVKSREHSNDYMLFEGLGKWTEKDGYGRYVGSKFNELLKKLGIEDKKTFHSFRGFFASELEQAGVSERDRYLITGRERRAKSSEEKHYLTNRELQHLYNQVIKVDFSDIIKEVKFFS